MKILETNRKHSTLNRFRIILGLLEGKNDITSNNPDHALSTGVDLSPATIRTFLNTLADKKLLKKEFHPGFTPPVCFVPPTPPHNEYFLIHNSIPYIKEQLVLWEASSFYDEELGAMVQEKLDNLKSKTTGEVGNDS
ncbi:hypothetical protein DSLASN_30510 [Desulfoluna limicola]|uniref:Transcriptional regulator n=1 Tax=Desulfoluna limicola TaxID=2810562 RepID=A0ABM7PIL6_9BACT|nr:hypothetical protein [Desulfoluna limicola]BCS97419.1 hypothetical protein DSLASN_30510 [Desulfoluna limicola]